MTYAQVTDSTITAIAGRLPTAARRLDTGEWVLGLPDAPVEFVEATGWFPVVDTLRPDDTATTFFVRSVDLVAGTPTVVWTETTKSQEQLDAEALQAVRSERDTQLQNAISTLETWSAQADAHIVTQGNAVVTIQTITDNLAIFYDRFAKLLRNQYGIDE